MAKRRRRKRQRGGWLMMVAIALLIAGFLARRVMMPSAAHYLAHYTQEYPVGAPPADESHAEPAPDAHANDNGSGEHLNDSDRRTLDEVIRRKTGGQ
jgi:hypothetical protein